MKLFYFILLFFSSANASWWSSSISECISDSPPNGYHVTDSYPTNYGSYSIDECGLGVKCIGNIGNTLSGAYVYAISADDSCSATSMTEYEISPCTEDDIPYSPILDENKTWVFVAEELESADLPSECSSDSSYVIQEGKFSCVTKFQCWKTNLPYFDCTQKEPIGEWETLSSDANTITSQQCFERVDNEIWDGASWESGDNYKDTCCLHNVQGGDTDGDGVLDAVEARNGTDSHNVDTDGDGKNDSEYVKDSDGDGINDALESSIIDSDGDGVDDEHDFFFTVDNSGLGGGSDSATQTISNNSDGTITFTITNEDGTTVSTVYNTDGSSVSDSPLSSTTTSTTANEDGTTTTTSTTTNEDGTATTTTTTTNPDGSSTTTTTDESNTTISYDTSLTDNLLKSLNELSEAQNNNLEGIKASIDSSSAQNHSDLGSVKDSIDSSSTQNHSDLGSVKDSIDSSSTQNHSDLTNIKDSIDSLTDGKSDSLDPSKNGIGDIVSQLNDIVSDATTTIPQKFNQLYNYSFGTAPVFTVSNGSCVFESDTNTMGYIKFDLNPYIAMMRPYTTLMFTLLFIFISVSWWYKAFKIIISVVF